MKNDLKLRQTAFIIYVISGFCWIVNGFLAFLPKDNLYSTLKIIVTAILAAVSCFIIFKGHEKSDEMGFQHYLESYTLGFFAILIAICLCYFVFLIYKALPVNFVLPFIIGVGFLTVGIRFMILEKEEPEDE